MVRVFGVFRGYQIRPLISDLWCAFSILAFRPIDMTPLGPAYCGLMYQADASGCG